MRRILALAIIALPAATWAQQQPGRKVEGELSGSVFFGNTSQTLASTRALFERRDSAFAVRASGRFHYGESTPEPGGTFVSKRAWEVGLHLENRPFGMFAPYLRGNLTASLENRIRRRSSAGLGWRYIIRRDSLTEVVLSAGALGERTEPLPTAANPAVVTLARGSSHLRMRRVLTPRVTLSSETTYEPALTQTEDYTIVSVNTLRTRLARFAALTVTFRNNYDNRARFRGARTNNDGELLVGLLTSF